MTGEPYNDSTEAYEDQQQVINDLLTALRDLVEWAAAMGGWEAPCWARAKALLDSREVADDLLTALEAAYAALQGLANHSAFEGDAPEFNEGGEPYEACQQIHAAITKAQERGGK